MMPGTRMRGSLMFTQKCGVTGRGQLVHDADHADVDERAVAAP